MHALWIHMWINWIVSLAAGRRHVSVKEWIYISHTHRNTSNNTNTLQHNLFIIVWRC